MNYTIVGKIINSHGIRGEVKVYPFTNDIIRFDFLKLAYIGESKILVNIESVKYHKGIVILKFKEYNDINDILKYKDSYIFVDDENRIILPKNHYFIYDLIGCNVVDTKGNSIGILKDVLQEYSNDVYVIKDKNESNEYLIPAVKKFIKDINIKEKLIIIDPIEGLIE
ncbi:MAG: ribosome maturation factor RimM [Tissierellia bacterium]|nr:ribosome maturation factor RimM [Tissierellia bacterium]MDD4725615.1 ribosome maturation factor RimM [Tissierellia bacterium]